MSIRLRIHASQAEESRYLQSLRDILEASYREQCEDAVVYSAAFGEQFEGLVAKPNFFHANVLQAIEKFGTCMFIFTSVTGDHDQFAKQNKNYPNIIPLDLTRLVNRADRRDVKLLKLSPTSLFPWAKRIIWQDIKMMSKNKFGYSLPTDYLGRYHDTVERHGVCASFMGLPFHRSTVGQNAESVTLQDHCDAIVAAKTKRETVTDNVDILLAQCSLYYKKYTNMSVQGAHVFHQHPLVDSAFMMFDMQTERCRQYNEDLLGTWLNEIYSYSDRDQVSFSTALASSHVHSVHCDENDGTEHCIASNRNSREGLEDEWSFEEGSVVDVLYDEKENEQPYWSKATVLGRIQQDDGDSRYNVIHHFDAYFQENVHKEKIRMARYDARVYANEHDERVVHISDTSCHWYIMGAVLSMGGDYTYRKPAICGGIRVPISASPKKVALIVAGTQKRFLFNSTLENLIAPMAKEGIEVDYYLSLLTTNKSKAYRSDSYMDRVISEFHSMTPRQLTDFIQESLSNVGSRATITIQDEIDLNLEPNWKKYEEKALREHPLEDPYIRFPMFDSRSEDVERRTSIGNKNLLKMHFAIKSLWADALLQEYRSGSKYDVVIFMRDDTLWIGEFNIGDLLSNDRVGDAVDVFIPSCDARIPPLHPMEVNDHIIIAKRSSADIFGDYYTRLFEVDTQECTSRLDNGVTKNGLRGCNSEMLLKFVLDKEGVRVRKVPQSSIPFQRAVRVELEDGTAKYCFHKFCQSKSSPLHLPDSIGLCKDIE